MIPAPGDWLITFPAGIVGSNAVVRVPTVSPGATMSWSASESDLLRTSGTVTAVGPRETVSLISVPDATSLPSAGSCASTVSGSTPAFSSVAARVTVSPRPSACAWASSNERSTNDGTETWAADADGDGESVARGAAPPPVSSRNTRKATTTRIARPSRPAIQAQGPESPSSSAGSITGGGGGAPRVETGAVGGTERAYASAGYGTALGFACADATVRVVPLAAAP